MNDTRMTRQGVLDAIARERERLMRAVAALGDAAATVAVTEEGWTAKDVLAHCIHWVTQIAFGLGAEVERPVYMAEERRRREAAGEDIRMPTADESNALAVAYYRDRSFEDVRAELERRIDALVERARERSDEQMNATDAIPWATGQPLWALIGGETFLHWPSHSEAMERVVGEGG